jgi:hypothetical protein
MTETARWLSENGIGGEVDYNALAWRQAEADDRAAKVAEARQAAGREEARDQQMVAYRLAGVQPGAAIARAQAIMDLETEIATRQAEIDKLTRRRERLVAEGQDQAEAVSRAATMVHGPVSASGVEGAVQRARQALAEEASWRKAERAVARRSVSRPKGPGGVAVRSEYCVHCTAEGVDDETSYLLHSDPDLNVPVTLPADVPDEVVTERAGRVDDLIAKGYSPRTARLAQEIVR